MLWLQPFRDGTRGKILKAGQGKAQGSIKSFLKEKVDDGLIEKRHPSPGWLLPPLGNLLRQPDQNRL